MRWAGQSRRTVPEAVPEAGPAAVDRHLVAAAIHGESDTPSRGLSPRTAAAPVPITLPLPPRPRRAAGVVASVEMPTVRPAPCAAAGITLDRRGS